MWSAGPKREGVWQEFIPGTRCSFRILCNYVRGFVPNMTTGFSHGNHRPHQYSTGEAALIPYQGLCILNNSLCPEVMCLDLLWLESPSSLPSGDLWLWVSLQLFLIPFPSGREEFMGSISLLVPHRPL